MAWLGGLRGQNIPCFLSILGAKHSPEADVVILAGVPLDFRLNYGESISTQAKLIRVDRDATELRRNRPGDSSEWTDPGVFLAALAKAAPEPAHGWKPWKDLLRQGGGRPRSPHRR